jgi:hypothetical protein
LYIEGIASQDEYLLMAQKNQNSTFRMSADDFTPLGCLFVKKNQKNLLASMKSPTNCENPSSNTLQESYSGYPTVD